MEDCVIVCASTEVLPGEMKRLAYILFISYGGVGAPLDSLVTQGGENSVTMA